VAIPEASVLGTACASPLHVCNAPHIVIDGQGYEVGVVVEYAQYVALLGFLAARLDRDALPPYWRGALDGCLVVDGPQKVSDGAAKDRSPGSC